MPQTAIPTSIVSVRPVVLSVPQRGDDLQMRVTLPQDAGAALPVVVFSHGFNASMDGYGPLADAWAAAGFAVIQPTHLDSSNLAMPADDPRTPEIWRWRIRDLIRVLDELDAIEVAVPGTFDRSRIAVAGHSWGATTASALLGARVIGNDASWADSRVTAGVLLAIAGHGGDDLTPFAAQQFPFMNPSFDEQRAPALIIRGDHDQSLLSTRGPDWWADAFREAPGAEALLTLHGAEHSLGGIPAYTPAKQMAASESPELVGLVRRATTAYLQHALLGDGDSWATLTADDLAPLGELELR